MSGARAEGAPPTTWSQEALEGEPDRVESPELRTLRLAEEELFGSQQASGLEGFDADRPGSHADAAHADAVTDAPPLSFERNGERVDLSFLKGLKLPSTPVHWDSRVIEYLLFFKEDPRGRELAGAWLKRRERFGPMVRRVLAEHSLPSDLQYVAMIESGYDPRAHSAAEAWGMWQFIEQPAQYYGLRVDHWADERLDPERSTRAAARFMHDLYDRFGNWELSFAAYNMGYGGLLRAIKKYNSNDYWLLSHLEAGLPFETSLYVAKISAMAIVANNPERFGFDKITPEPTVQLAKIDVAVGSSLAKIAEAANLTLEQLKAVNPHLLQSRVPPGDPAVQVYLPREAQVRFAQHWSAQHEQTPLPYVVRLGETLEQVAKRTGTSAQKLRELNELDADAVVKAGFALFVPSHAKPLLEEQLVCSVPARDFSYPDRKRVFYRVGPEDSTAEVARFFAVTPDELISWNSVAPGAALQAGMLLQLFVQPERDLSQAVVYTPDEVRVLTVGSNEFFDYHESQRGRVRVHYRVQKSDTLAGLAKRFDLSAGSIGRINQFPSNRELRTGERITMYAPLEELPKLEQAGLIERFVVERDDRVLAQQRTPSELAEVELPESEGLRALEPKQESPLAPPPKKRVEAASLPLPTPKNAKTPRPASKPSAKKPQ
ncbi:MAG: Membrane-bound lytic murein transglycosylase precursor [Myxococcaceae bacterium]|nr:Membrane-bound lytic murein transglycosylase precursor [Myxococcaceae bacterium]